MSRRAKRWVAITWAALVALGGGATLVIENAGPPENLVGVYGPEPAPSRSPAGGDGCPPPPNLAELAENDSDGVFGWACLETVGPSLSVEVPEAENGDATNPKPFPSAPRPGGDRHCPGEEAEHTSVFCAHTSGE